MADDMDQCYPGCPHEGGVGPCDDCAAGTNLRERARALLPALNPEERAAIVMPWVYQVEGSSRIRTRVLRSLEKWSLTEHSAGRLHFKTELAHTVRELLEEEASRG